MTKSGYQKWDRKSTLFYPTYKSGPEFTDPAVLYMLRGPRVASSSSTPIARFSCTVVSSSFSAVLVLVAWQSYHGMSWAITYSGILSVYFAQSLSASLYRLAVVLSLNYLVDRPHPHVKNLWDASPL